MTTTVSVKRTQAAAALPDFVNLKFGNVSSVVDTTRYPVGLSRDRATLYCATTGGTKLQGSTDDAASWTDVHTFPEAIVTMQFLDDGECLVVTQNGSSTPGYIYRSTGWSTNPATATWAKTLTSVGGYFNEWGLSQWSIAGATVVANEYGPQTPNAGYATRVYLSQDYGKTWKQILDLATLFPGVNPVHAHGCAYDAQWGRIWLSHGDVPGNVAESINAPILYSDDFGKTWNVMPTSSEWQGSYFFQVTGLAVLDELALLMLPDGIPYGIVVCRRAGYRVLGPQTTATNYAGGTGSQGIGGVFTRAYAPGSPLFATIRGVTGVNNPGRIACSLDNGKTWSVLVTDYNAGADVQYAPVFGPTVNGKVHYVRTSDGTWFNAELVDR